jgi:hypothetical protein
MPRYWGVKCKVKDGPPIVLATLESLASNEIAFTTVPLEPIPCPVCGGTHRYTSAEAVEFEADNLVGGS